MPVGQKLIPQRIDIDRYPALATPDVARFIKNLVYDLGDTSTATNGQNSATGSYKPLQSVVKYIDDFILPDRPEDNFPIGKIINKENREVFALIHNKNGNHTIYRINGHDSTYDVVAQGDYLGFQLNPEHFIHEGAGWCEVIYVTDPDSGEKRKRTFVFYTDAFNDIRFICAEDAVATNGFDATLFPYFQGNYNKEELITAGIPTPKECLEITEVPITDEERTKPNKLLFNTWQFRLMTVDVWGRPSEHGIISNLYIPGGGDCLSQSSSLPRCLDLTFDVPPPHINSIQVEFRNCNEQQWYISETLYLYNGSPLGDWWLRQRNTDIGYNTDTTKITYRFCADDRCDPIPVTETNRLQNPIPRTSVATAKIGKYNSLSNNEDGFLPLSQDLLSKINITVETPSQQTDNKLRNIDIWMQIWNPFLNHDGAVYLRQNKYWFGVLAFGFANTNIIGIPQGNGVDEYEQFFTNTAQQGFIGILAGTNITTISKQYALGSDGTISEVTDFSTFDKSKRYFQRFQFSNVKAGKYVFRILSHEADLATTSITEAAKTSTYTAGVFPFNINNTSVPVSHPSNLGLNEFAKELVVDVCHTDYTSQTDTKILVVFDFSNSQTTVNAGYVKNTNDVNSTQFGVELLNVRMTNTNSGGVVSSWITDHNGFYYVANKTTLLGGQYKFSFEGFCGCSRIKLDEKNSGQTDKLFRENIFLNLSSYCTAYETQVCNYIEIKGKVQLCDSTVGVPGIGVVLTRGQTAVTDANGEFTLIAHDDTLNAQRIDQLYYTTNTCNFNACDGGCIEPVQVTIYRCITCEPREQTVPTLELFFTSEMGLLSGGTYPLYVQGKDWLGRSQFSQLIKNVLIPSVQETKTFSPSRIRVQIPAGTVFPSEFEYLTFSIGEETTISDYVTWIVDRVEFIDNTGNPNNISPTQIKIYYASLVEYNTQNNFNTTVNWSFISQETNTPVISDQVLFLINGDGEFFSKTITAQVKYDQNGEYFLINYTEDLKDLKENAVIRIFRPKVCEVTEPTFELCFTNNLIDGVPETLDFYLNAFDTYYINRQIPVPVLLNDDETVNQLRVLGIPFEHNSPSDFWGQGCKNIGRVNTVNTYETVLYHQEQIALSGALSENSQLNFLCYFDSARKFNFDENEINGIVSVLPYPGIVLVIGQLNNFLVGFNDNLLRINQDGTAQAGSIKNSFGEPNVKTSGNYGCLLFDKNTISRHENIVQWLDTTKATVVQHNYQQAIQLTQYDPKLGIPGGVDSWIRPKIKAVQQYNLANGNQRYFHGIINPVNQEYLLTDFVIGHTAFLNTERGFNIAVPETLAVNTVTKLWKVSYGFTPPMYAQLQGEIEAQQLFSFPNGIPYKHYSTSIGSYGTAYGQDLVRIFETTAVIEGMNKKRFNSISLYCKQSQYFCDTATTENGQQTRMLLGAWLQAEYGWHTPFLCDINTPPDNNRPKQTGTLVIFEGNVMYGNFVIIRLIGDPNADNKYSELEGIIVYASPQSIQ